MAKRLNADTAAEAAQTPEQKKSNRRETISGAIKEIVTLLAQKKGISDQIAEIKNVKIKGELGMKLADFNAALRMYGLDQEARDIMLDTIRETFDALGIGEQIDWIKATERPKPTETAAAPALAADPEPAAPKGDGIYSDVMSAVIHAGSAAGMAGEARDSNPHGTSTEEYKSWDKGWRNGLKQRNADANRKARPAEATQAEAHA